MVLYLKLKRVELLVGADDVSTVLADGEGSHLSLESALAEILLGSVFEGLLKTVEAEVQEFLRVLLHSNVRGIAT